MNAPSAISPATFASNDHDLLLECVYGIKQILEKMTIAEKRVDGVDSEIKDLKLRMKGIEDWKIRVGSMLLALGVILGYAASVVKDLAVAHLPR